MNSLQQFLEQGVKVLTDLAPSEITFDGYTFKGVLQQAPLEASRMLEEGYRHELSYTLHVAAANLPPVNIPLRCTFTVGEEAYTVESLTRSEGFMKFNLRRQE